MINDSDLQRFILAQEGTYELALAEIRRGRKRSHWMWYIFPQLSGLGFSATSVFFALNSIDEAEAFLRHPVLSMRLRTISLELINQPGNDAALIFGTPDDLKLRSSMTLFACLPGADPVFQSVLDKFFGGIKDPKTLQFLNA